MAAVRERVLSVVVAASTIIVLVAFGIAPFFSPPWIYPGQDRAQAEAWTGWPSQTVHDVTGSVLHDLLIGPPTFAQAVAGQPVFDEAEASHLRDVRRVVLAFGAVALAAAVILLAAWALMRPRGAFWRAVEAGTKVLAVGVVALGIFAVVAFDTAFEIFHRLFFAPGTYSFDPATERLVQLFPDAFWSQTSIAIGIWLIVIAVVVWRFAAGRARRLDAATNPQRSASVNGADGGGPIPNADAGPAPGDEAVVR